MSRSWIGGKGDNSRVSNTKSYRDNHTNIDFSKKRTKYIDPIVEEDPPMKKTTIKKCLMLDDIREVRACWVYSENKYLEKASGISHWNWDVVRSYDAFVKYIEEHGIPDIVSFDNDLDPFAEYELMNDMQSSGNYDHKRLNQKTGCHCAEYLADKCVTLQHPIPEYYVHSANSLARPIIGRIMESAKRKIAI